MTWLRDTFKQEIEKIRQGGSLDSPARLEIHPHHASTDFCNNTCESCTGLKYRNGFGKKLGIKPEALLRTIDSLKGKVNRVLFSGCCIEPLLYPEIAEVLKQTRQAVPHASLYSNFYFADKPGVLEQLADFNLVRISLDAGSSRSYRETHNPQDKNAFYKILDNIKALVELKRKKQTDVRVQITYLLTKYNSLPQELKGITDWAKLKGVDEVRFSFYQKPLGRKTRGSSFVRPDVLDSLRELKDWYFPVSGDRDFISIREERTSLTQKQKPFKKCLVRKLFGVIGFDGGVYPCTAMASPDSPDYYIYGNINDEDYLDVWEKIKKSKDFPLGKCYDCTRCEFESNVLMNDNNT